jgi:hypothetical protein
MTTALQAAERHLAELAANGVPAKDKPSAFHHGLITTLVAELKAAGAKLERLRTLALDWCHGEDCNGYGMDADLEWDECDCGVGDVIRETSPAGIEVYIDRTTERYGMSRILEPKAAL